MHAAWWQHHVAGPRCCFTPNCICSYHRIPSCYHQACAEKHMHSKKHFAVCVWPAQSHLVIRYLQGAQRATCLCVCISTVRCQTLEAEQLQAPALHMAHNTCVSYWQELFPVTVCAAAWQSTWGQGVLTASRHSATAVDKVLKTADIRGAHNLLFPHALCSAYRPSHLVQPHKAAPVVCK
jgi:hypothetical protein